MHQAGQVSGSAAEIYDAFFVPALFGPWARPLCLAAGLGPGQAVLDVACGSGSTTRVAAGEVHPGGNVTGLDRNDGMLAVARARAPDIAWQQGLAEALPFEEDAFDVVVCQFGLMFFDDREVALREMQRVVRPGGRIAVSVWDKADNSPGYAAMIDLIDRLFGKEAANALRAPFNLGEPESLHDVLEAAGMQDAVIETQDGVARFPSIDEWVRLDVRGWTLADMIDDAGFEKLVNAARTEMAGFARTDGTVEFAAPAHIAVWSA